MKKAIGDAAILEKRIQKSSKFDNVKPMVDSGYNSNKYFEKHPETSINARFKREENFKRMKPKHLVALMQSDAPEKDVLLLDVRSEEEFEKCHIEKAVLYPAPMLSRSVNPFIPQIYEYRNREDRVIVLYDLDERVAVPAGNQFFEKGFDNICILTGGLREFSEQFREFVTGMPPSPRAMSVSGLSSASTSRRSSTGSSAASVTTTASTTARSTATARSNLTTATSETQKPWK